MIDLIRRHPKAFTFSVLLHGIIIVLAIVEFTSKSDSLVLNKPANEDTTIQAEVINQKQLDKRADEIKKQQELKKKREQDKQRKLQAEKKRTEELKKKQQQEKVRKQEAQKKAKAEADKKKKAEALKQKKLAAEKRKKTEAEKKKKAEAEKKRKAEQKKAAAEAEKKRKIEEAKRKAEEEKRKLEEAKKKAEAERKEAERQARLKAEAEQRQKEAELNARLAAEERQRALDISRNRYYSLIRQKISRNWRQPANAGSKPACEVSVIQGPGGVILDVTFGQCPGTREYRLSVEAAVLKSDPLPKPEDPELFERDIKLIFKPEN